MRRCPMPTARPSRPTARPAPAPAPSGDPPAVQLSPRCPSCGRQPAVVFQVFQAADGRPLAAPKQVCLECCPKTDDTVTS